MTVLITNIWKLVFNNIFILSLNFRLQFVNMFSREWYKTLYAHWQKNVKPVNILFIFISAFLDFTHLLMVAFWLFLFIYNLCAVLNDVIYRNRGQARKHDLAQSGRQRGHVPLDVGILNFYTHFSLYFIFSGGFAANNDYFYYSYANFAQFWRSVSISDHKTKNVCKNPILIFFIYLLISYFPGALRF